jgi:hypothetical protein
MSAEPSLLARYWGKAAPPAPGGPSHHTVLGHSLDVGACAFVLVERHPVLRAQFGAETRAHATPITLASALLCGPISRRIARS